MAIYKVRKRNGAIVTFDRSKIEYALKKAIEAAGGKDFSEVVDLTDKIIERVEVVAGKNVPDIEMIQDKVEEILIKHGHDTVAKNYIIYRQKRTEARHDRDVVVEVGKTMDEYLDQTDWRVNANANSGYSLGGLILNVSGKVTANYWLSHVYPAEIGNNHRNGDYHIHDLDMFCGYCAGWSLRQLLEEGFNGAPNRIESSPPRNLQAAVNQMINFLGTLQNEWAGAQAFSSFDTYLAPFVHKYEEEVRNDIEKYAMKFDSEAVKEQFITDKVYKNVYQNLQNFVFGLNVPSRWGTQTPFTNITLDWVCPEDLKDKALHLGGYDKGLYKKNYSELQKEMDLINKVLIEIYTKGDAKGRVFTFPIPTYNITEDFDWDSSNTELLFEMTAKYGLPYFQNFIGSQFKREKNAEGNTETVRNADAYTPGAVRSMCCRLQLDLKELLKRGNGLFGSAEMTGSIGVVTINMARIGYNTKGDKEAFKSRIEYLMNLAKTSLELKREELTKWLDRGFYPYTYRYLKSFRNHFSTIGLNGMNEAILNFTDGKENVSTKYGKELSIEIMEFMREILKKYQEETGNLYNLEATPAEGTTYRFAREDKKQIPNIIQAGTQEAPYYTNSSQLPVGFTDDAFEALEYQNDLQCKYTGGTVLHLYMGERISDATACKNLVKKVITNYQLPYITISPTFSICPKHGYIAGEFDYCPKCDAEMGFHGQKLDLDARVKYTEDPEKLAELRQQA
ncbi:MAG: ribonucleoside triphosphate reductase [Candidatus Gracilibacteria bacterium]|nr:ribonucleoside triphosphate reductase [Candidatus Gracilibacteria bacterium]MDD2909036.1 ribonucleoside triphosphate reductase [Candidatus Gracilibacteria bacterium]